MPPIYRWLPLWPHLLRCPDLRLTWRRDVWARGAVRAKLPETADTQVPLVSLDSGPSRPERNLLLKSPRGSLLFSAPLGKSNRARISRRKRSAHSSDRAAKLPSNTTTQTTSVTSPVVDCNVPEMSVAGNEVVKLYSPWLRNYLRK